MSILFYTPPTPITHPKQECDVAHQSELYSRFIFKKEVQNAAQNKKPIRISSNI